MLLTKGGGIVDVPAITPSTRRWKSSGRFWKRRACRCLPWSTTAERPKSGNENAAHQAADLRHPSAGTPLMLAAPSLALDLPLKVLIREDDNGRVLVSRIEHMGDQEDAIDSRAPGDSEPVWDHDRQPSRAALARRQFGAIKYRGVAPPSDRRAAQRVPKLCANSS